MPLKIWVFEKPNLIVYARWVNTQSGGNLQYTINNGSFNSLGQITSNSCGYFAKIENLQIGDQIEFSDSNGYTIAGSATDCPTSAFSCNYTTTITTNGANYAYITVDASFAC